VTAQETNGAAVHGEEGEGSSSPSRALGENRRRRIGRSVADAGLAGQQGADRKKDNKKLKTDTITTPRRGNTITYTKSKTT
jgi:hypothetical protein